MTRFELLPEEARAVVNGIAARVEAKLQAPALTNVTDYAALLERAWEIVELFKRAQKLGFVIEFTPEQLQLLVAVCEEAYIRKSPK